MYINHRSSIVPAARRTLSRAWRFVALAVMTAAVFVLTGCFELHETLKLNKDGSGDYTFSAKMDLAPIIDMVVSMDNTRSREEIRAELMDKQTESLPPIEAPDDMSKGLTWLGGENKIDGDVMSVWIKVGFDQLSSLQQPVSGDEGDGLLRLKPTFDGKKLSFSGLIYEGVDEAGKDPGTTMMLGMAEGAKLTFEIDAPKRKAKTHNATRKEGSKLIWEYTLQQALESPKVEVQYK